MANAFYPSYRNLLGTTGINLTSADIRIILIDLADYTYSGTHDFLNDVVGAGRVATSSSLTSPTFGTVSTGTFDAADVTFSSVTGDQSEAIIIYRHTGTESTSDLILYLDTGITGIPVTPNGGNINVVWNASGIFTLA